METTLVLQDPAFTALGGRSSAQAGSGEASMLFASTLQQELSDPDSADQDTLAALSSMPRSLRADSAEWWRTPQTSVSLAATAQTEAVSAAAATPASATGPAALSLLGLSRGSAALPDASETEDHATTTGGTGNPGFILTAPAAVASMPATTNRTAHHKEQPATAAAMEFAGKAAATRPTHDARSMTRKSGHEQREEPMQDPGQPQALPFETIDGKFAEPLALQQREIPPEPDTQSGMTPVATMEDAAQPAAAAPLPAADMQALATPQTQTQTQTTLPQRGFVAGISGSLGGDPAHPSFAPAISMAHVRANSGNSENPVGNEAMLLRGGPADSLSTPAAQAGSAPAWGATTGPWHEPGEKPLHTRQVTSRAAMAFMQDGPADNVHRFVVPQAVLAPEPDASFMQQALAMAALRQTDATAAAEPRSSTDMALPFSLQTETAVGTEGWGEEIGQHISWLSEQKISKAELTLHPAELGALDITINNEDERVTITIVTRNEAARELLQDNLPRLAELLRHNGLTLEQGSVSQQSAGRQDAPAPNTSGRFATAEGQDPAAADAPRLRSALLHHGQIDHYV